MPLTFGFLSNQKIDPFIAYSDIAGTSDNGATYSFVGMDIGTVSSDRIVLVGVGARSGSNGQCNSLTVGGVAATLITRTTGSSNSTSIWAIPYPTGTTATIEPTFSVAQTRCGIVVWNMVNKSSLTPFDVYSVRGSSIGTQSVNVPEGGAVICVAFDDDDGTTPKTPTLSNMTTSVAIGIADTNAAVVYGAFGNDTTAGTASFGLSSWDGAVSLASWVIDS